MIDDRLSAILDFSHRCTKTNSMLFLPGTYSYSFTTATMTDLIRIWLHNHMGSIKDQSRALLGMSTLSFNPKCVDCKRKQSVVRHEKWEIIMLAQTTCAFCHNGRKSFYSLNKIYRSPYSVFPNKSSQTCPIPNTQVIITSAPHMNIKFSIASSDLVPCKQKPAFPYFHVNVSI